MNTQVEVCIPCRVIGWRKQKGRPAMFMIGLTFEIMAA